MENDFVKELGYLGFTMRLKRINDMLIREGRKLYKELGVDIEPNWYVIFELLKVHQKLSITEIAGRIHLAHPSVITITNKMIKAGYLESKTGTNDNRVRVLALTEKARKKLPAYEKIWKSGEKGIARALEHKDGLGFLDLMEQTFDQNGFVQLTLDEYHKHQK
ncbi:MarR family transcriptional regulator [Sinomicrobium kalidii]|uniref:MarR family winged helix-turn-helix transcriptional regulator n=1 Tax=Sinomicrobium kalidii TaxID=2900738 RepID=UPI001E62BD3A|nr:MarR family transcriptional regulator [Sinomicrobium kalidii]UGU18288.1 MarR family transcriptional regulator [Sinomicrobium kalidii]